MTKLGFDSETHLLKPGILAPRLVCVSYATESASNGAVVLRPEGLALLRNWLTNPELLLIAHNLPFDIGVVCAEDLTLLPLVFDAFRAGRLCCTMVRQKLLDIARGERKWRRYDERVARASYGLDDLVKHHFNEFVDKSTPWRLRFAELDGVPVEQWPDEPREYAIKDAVDVLRIHDAQDVAIRQLLSGLDMPPSDKLPNEDEQQQAAWALHLMSMWGIRAEPTQVEKFIANCEREIAKMHDDLAETGIFRAKKDGTKSRVMKEIRLRVQESLTRLSVAVPMTDPSPRFPDGQVGVDKETLELTDDPDLHVLASQLTFEKHLGQWGPVCRAAVLRPVICSYNVLVETGRTSAHASRGQEGSNIQNPPRKGDVRPCFTPRPGHLFLSTDADTVEIRAHAQNCLEMLGWSKTADILREQERTSGPDVHETLAGLIMGIDAKEVQRLVRAGDKDAEDARQFAKIPNYGFPGGMKNPLAFMAYARGQMSKEAYLKWFTADRDVAQSKARHIRELWLEAMPENREYFARISSMVGRAGGMVVQLMSGRIRGDTRYTAACNGFFQGRVADAMKEALWRLAEECYTGRETTKENGATSRRSVLHGSRVVMFLHDEPITEVVEDGLESERAERQRLIVVESLQRWMPDVPVGSSAVLTRRWFKGAKPLKVDGKLVPVKPEKQGDKMIWVQDWL